jgi:hypothetical protein
MKMRHETGSYWLTQAEAEQRQAAKVQQAKELLQSFDQEHRLKLLQAVRLLNQVFEQFTLVDFELCGIGQWFREEASK